MKELLKLAEMPRSTFYYYLKQSKKIDKYKEIKEEIFSIFHENKGIRQSMSRKGNCLDNGYAENFFGILKSEMFYPKEKEYTNIEDLEKDIIEYIEYYNNRRIKSKLKGMSPAQYRKHSYLVA